MDLNKLQKFSRNMRVKLIEQIEQRLNYVLGVEDEYTQAHSGRRACSRSDRMESRVALRAKEHRLTTSTCMSSCGAFSVAELCVLSRELVDVLTIVSGWGADFGACGKGDGMVISM